MKKTWAKTAIRWAVWPLLVVATFDTVWFAYGDEILITYHVWRLENVSSAGYADIYRLAAIDRKSVPFMLERLRNGSDKQKDLSLMFFNEVRGSLLCETDVRNVVKAAEPLLYHDDDGMLYSAAGFMRRAWVIEAEEAMLKFLHRMVGRDRCSAMQRVVVAGWMDRAARRGDFSLALAVADANDPELREDAMRTLTEAFSMGRRVDQARRDAVQMARKLRKDGQPSVAGAAVCALAASGDESAMKTVAGLIRLAMQGRGNFRLDFCDDSIPPHFVGYLVELLPHATETWWRRGLCRAIERVGRLPYEFFKYDPERVKAWWKARESGQGPN